MTLPLTHPNQPPSDNVKPASSPVDPQTPAQVSPTTEDPPLSPGTPANISIETPPRLRPSFNVDDKSTPSASLPTIHLPVRPRPTSPSSSAARPHSSGGLSSMPPMQRAYSSPGLDSTGRFITPPHVTPRRPSSPLSSGRRRSPMRTAFDESYPSSWSGLSIEPNIPEHAELELGSPMISEDTLGSASSIPLYSNTFPRSRRRPASPLHQSASAPSLYARSTSPHLSGAVSPGTIVKNYPNEPYPSYSYSSASSMPSTPTSLRSRSPSISSLETIEDTPDAEEAARLEAEEARARGDDTDSSVDTRRRSLDLRASTLRSNKERKRWSVCGAERRADFSLEPIEE